MRFVLSLLLGLALGWAAAPAYSQSSVSVQRVQTQTQPDGRLSAAFQAAMESGQYRRAGQMIGADGLTRSGAPSRRGGMSIAAPGGGTLDYTCNGGNCACAGAADCVAMAPICEEGTMGCNDYGCTCKEAEGD